MSGEIKVLKISPTTGTDVTMGDSGDKFTFASGSEVILTGVTKTGFPAGGLTDATIWRQNTTTRAGPRDTFFTAGWAGDSRQYRHWLCDIRHRCRGNEWCF